MSKETNTENKDLTSNDVKPILAEVNLIRARVQGIVRDYQYELECIHHKVLMLKKIDCEFELLHLRNREKTIKESKWLFEEILDKLKSDTFKN